MGFLILLFAQQPGKIAAAPVAKDAGDCHLESEERQRDRNGRHLVGIVELADKKGIREVVKDIHQHAEHAGQGQVDDGTRNGHLFQDVELLFFHACDIFPCESKNFAGLFCQVKPPFPYFSYLWPGLKTGRL